ncbi:MAG: hypothetical protein UT50_C0002G0018 [Candidatus Moranbacteria bacterium GW2011_GWA2_39_41]|nr:MAG: hypothetical protein UT50_C0002G0018 [Candidatus Moranbacteria bacterium GW2011_GWA2_39_41]
MDEIKTEETVVAPVTESTSKKFFKQVCECGKKKKHIVAGVVLLAILLGAGGYYYKTKKTDIGLEGAKTKVLEFVNGTLLQPGMTAEFKDSVLENGLYRVTIKVGEQEIPTYITTDGAKFFPQAMEINPADKLATDAPVAEAKEIPKTDKPSVELFVMSYCPYGTQMEKGILPVITTLGSKIDYKLKFVDYAMHGDKEIDENLRQYCIQKNQPARLSAYLTCFLKKGEGTADACMTFARVSTGAIKSCVAQTDTQFNVKKDAVDKSKWSNGQFPPFGVDKTDNVKYGVQGSPTLVVNGVTAQSGRDSASILKAICGAFNNAPKECEAKLSVTAPAAGFGEGTATAGASAASCEN